MLRLALGVELIGANTETLLRASHFQLAGNMPLAPAPHNLLADYARYGSWQIWSSLCTVYIMLPTKEVRKQCSQSDRATQRHGYYFPCSANTGATSFDLFLHNFVLNITQLFLKKSQQKGYPCVDYRSLSYLISLCHTLPIPYLNPHQYPT